MVKSNTIENVVSDVVSRYYAYQGNSPLVEYDSTGTIKKKYIYALGRFIAYIDSAGGTYYLHHDALGSVRKKQYQRHGREHIPLLPV